MGALNVRMCLLFAVKSMMGAMSENSLGNVFELLISRRQF